LTQSTALPTSSARPGVPHAYGFVYNRVLGNAPPPELERSQACRSDRVRRIDSLRHR
jgi:hypothetical protein